MAGLERRRSIINLQFMLEMRKLEENDESSFNEEFNVWLSDEPLTNDEICRLMRGVERERKLEGKPPLVQFLCRSKRNHLRHLLSKVMGTAVNWDYVPNNPVRGVKMPERALKRPHRFLTAEEVRRLIAASNEPLRTIIILATMTGLRIGEILALRWRRIDLRRETLRVAETCYVKFHWLPRLCVN